MQRVRLRWYGPFDLEDVYGQEFEEFDDWYIYMFLRSLKSFILEKRWPIGQIIWIREKWEHKREGKGWNEQDCIFVGNSISCNRGLRLLLCLWEKLHSGSSLHWAVNTLDHSRDWRRNLGSTRLFHCPIQPSMSCVENACGAELK